MTDADPPRSSSTTTPSSARACARSSARATASRWSGEAGDVDGAVAAAARARTRRRAPRPRDAGRRRRGRAARGCSALDPAAAGHRAHQLRRATTRPWPPCGPAPAGGSARTCRRPSSSPPSAPSTAAARCSTRPSPPACWRRSPTPAGRRRPRPAHRPRARGAGAARRGAVEQGPRRPALRGREDGEDPRVRRSSASSTWPTARRRRCSPSATVSSEPEAGVLGPAAEAQAISGPMAADGAVRTVGA